MSPRHAKHNEQLHITTGPTPSLASSFAALPGRARTVIIAAAIVVVTVVVVGAVTATVSVVLAGVGVAAAAGVSVATIRQTSNARFASRAVTVLCLVAAVTAGAVDTLPWGVTGAAVLIAAAALVEVVARNFAPSGVRLHPQLRARLAALPNYDVIDLPVPGGAEALVVDGRDLFLIGGTGPELAGDIEASGEYTSFVARRDQLAPVLARQGLKCGAIVIVEGKARYGPRRTDDGVVLCAFAQLRKAVTYSAKGARNAAKTKQGGDSKAASAAEGGDRDE